MNCADLDRYLEAHLDGQLARGRLRALKQHLLVCTDCRLRVHALQAFEQQLQRRFRCMQESMPLWAGLEVDLVGEAEARPPLALPPPPLRLAVPVRMPRTPREPSAAAPKRPTTRSLRPLIGRYALRVVGLAMLAAAAATVLEMAAGLFGNGSEPSRGGVVTDFGAAPAAGLATLEATDPARLEEWLAANLGRTYVVPAAPAGFELRGGRVVSLAGRPMAAVVYAVAGREVVVFIARREEGALLVQALGAEAYVWWEDEFVYGAVGAVPAAELRRFREVTGTAL